MKVEKWQPDFFKKFFIWRYLEKGLQISPKSDTLILCWSSLWICFFEDFFWGLSTQQNRAAPRLNTVPSKVYKKCPKISKFLFKTFFMYKQGYNATPLMECQGIYIPKSNNPTDFNISDFHPTALHYVEHKHFFNLVCRVKWRRFLDVGNTS